MVQRNDCRAYQCDKLLQDFSDRDGTVSAHGLASASLGGNLRALRN